MTSELVSEWATPPQKACPPFQLSLQQPFNVIFKKLMKMKSQLLKTFDVVIKRSKKVVICVHINTQVDAPNRF